MQTYDIVAPTSRSVAEWIWDCGLLHPAPVLQVMAASKGPRLWECRGLWSVGEAREDNPRAGFIEGFLAMGGTDGAVVFPRAVVRVRAGEDKAVVAYGSDSDVGNIVEALTLLR